MNPREIIAAGIRESISVKEAVLRDLVPAIEKAAGMLADCVKRDGRVFFFGNGGSASDSQHLAAEFVGRYEKERRALGSVALTTDTSILTAVGNDYGFDRIFERQIDALGRKGDVAVALSTSGNSKNVLRAAERAKAKGLSVIALTGATGGELKRYADLCLCVPSNRTSRVQESHILIGHILCEIVDQLV